MSTTTSYRLSGVALIVGSALSIIYLLITSVTIISQMTAHIVPQEVSVATTPPPAWAPFFLVSLVGQVLGILLLAIATLRARVFPRWTAWLLIATLVVGVVSFVPFFPEALSNLAAIIASVAVAGFGFALLSPGQHASMEVVPTSAQVEAHA
jgi:hypothetical protein